MPYVSGHDINGLAGARFQIDGINFTVPESQFGHGWPRVGAEGYGLLVVCHHPTIGTIPSFMKVFSEDVPERVERTNFLVTLGLKKSHEWLFKGVPYASFFPKIINNNRLVGHIAEQLGADGSGAEDLSRLKEMNPEVLYQLSRGDRIRLIGQLCCAVYALEQRKIVHGDLSHRNIMIGPSRDGELRCWLCDFDGIFHPTLQRLPRKVGKTPCRPLGSTGYQYPELLNRIDSDIGSNSDDLLVETDRFALAVLCCELMVWSKQVEIDLGDRWELLSTDIIKNRDIFALPLTTRNLWPEGFEALQRALSAPHISQMPSPEEWLRLLGVVTEVAVDFKTSPRVTIRKRDGFRLTPVADVTLKSKQGSLSNVNQALGGIHFRLDGKKLFLDLSWNAPIFLQRFGKQVTLGTGPRSIQVSPGDAISTNFWEFSFTET